MIELQPVNDLKRCLHDLGFLDRNDTLLAHFFHGLGNDVADGMIVVGRYGADLCDIFFVLNLIKLHAGVNRYCFMYCITMK
jgi:hypothetical protein